MRRPLYSAPTLTLSQSEADDSIHGLRSVFDFFNRMRASGYDHEIQ